jgi:hypothetical protein
MSLHPTAVGLDKSRTVDDQTEHNLLEDTLKTIEELFALRLVDRIARPKDIEYKQREIERFGAKMKILH